MIRIFLLSLLLFACAEQTDQPEDLISEDLYIDLLVELRVLQTYQYTFFDSTTTTSYLDSLYKKYDISKERLERSISYYEKEPDEQHQRKLLVEKRLEAELEKLEIKIKNAIEANIAQSDSSSVENNR